MKKQNILALALKPARRVTKSVGIGIVPMLAAALIAMITPSAASVRRPCRGTHRQRPVTGGAGVCEGQHVGPDGALYVTEGAAGRISRVDPQTGEIRLPPAVCRPQSSASVGRASVGRSTSRSSTTSRTHWSPSSALTSAAATLTASTE